LRLVSQYRANEAFRQLPILLIAEDIDLIRVAKGLVDLGANDYLIRPVDRQELLARTATQIRRKRLQDRLQQNYQRGLSLALTDPLTSLYVRRYGEAHLDELIERVNQDAASAAVLLFDVDHFKQVNDVHGHDAGDDVLRELAARTLKSVRSVDLAVRWGGKKGKRRKKRRTKEKQEEEMERQKERREILRKKIQPKTEKKAKNKRKVKREK